MSEQKTGLCVGCGYQKAQSNENITWINLDNDESVSPDVLRDINRGLPFADNTFDVVFCSHVLEHFGGADFVFVMNEIHRVLKPRGEIHVLSPYYKFWGAYIDPFHKMIMNEHTFQPFRCPSVTSKGMGVTGIYVPIIVQVAEEMELRVVMRKVPNEQLREYVDSFPEKKCPDFLEIVKGRTYEYGVTA